MNIGIDIDDTIADTYNILLKYVQEYIIHDIVKDIEKSSKDMLAQMYETKFNDESKRKGKEFFDIYYDFIYFLLQKRTGTKCQCQ